MPIAQHIYPLKGKVQHYSWGGYDYIPQLLSIVNSDKLPFAEYWLGAHPNHPSIVKEKGNTIELAALIEQYKEEVLGADVTSRFGELPFLLKVLDVRQMLSIQVHPNKISAQTGFHKENDLGIPLTAAYRNYKDGNHKPEMMVALGDFWLLHGFKPHDKLISTLSAIPDFSFLLEEFESKGYKALYEKVMLMDQEEVNGILEPIITKILPLYKNEELLKSQESFWAARAAETFCKQNNYDRGIFSIYFFNLVHLKKGEGIYQPAGLPHAYLEGQNVELMANSDNVLRAGLTDKHIDVPELLRHVNFQETNPNILSAFGEAAETIKFDTPAEEFQMYKYSIRENSVEVKSPTAEIILVIDGEVIITTHEQSHTLKKGAALFVVANTTYSISGDAAEVFRATSPSN